MIYNVFVDVYKKRNTAGLKAPADIANISKKNGYKRFDIPVYTAGNSKLKDKIVLVWTMASYLGRLFFTLKPGDKVIMQHPNYGIKPLIKGIPIIRKFRTAEFIVLIHDLPSLRTDVRDWTEERAKWSRLADSEFLCTFDYVISHNSHMSEYLKQIGIPEDNIRNLEIFDYLNDSDRKQPSKCKVPTITIAGYLGKTKCNYIYDMIGDPDQLHVNLYGLDFDEDSKKENMTYFGSFNPEELVDHLEGDFGLVWDGESAKTCTGIMGEYLRYNNPHKTSLYLSSNMPVIVWKEAAIADFVRKHGVGILVDSLNEIPSAIQALSAEEYQKICENVKKISDKLRSGYYFTTAVNACTKRR